MDRLESVVHHDTYEYAVKTLGSIQSSSDESPHVILNKDAILRLTACYMHLYNDVYINKRITPFKDFVPKGNIH